jgi:hypothetical protein
MDKLTRLEYIEQDFTFGAYTETVFIELYIDYRTNKKYILNKINYSNYAFVKEYAFDELKDSIFILPCYYGDECIYGKNPDSENSWRIYSDPYEQDFLTEDDIIH